MTKTLDSQRCGVVILNYGSHDLTVALANKLVGFGSVSDICVVDNCSGDDFDTDFSSSKIHYIKNKKNTGYSAGNNVGLRYLVNEKKCGYVFIANPDVIFENSTIEAMHLTLLEHSDMALIATKRYGHNGTTLHQYFEFPTLMTSVKNCFFIPRRKFEKRRHFIQNMKIDLADGPVYVDAVPGAFFGIKSEFLLKNNFLYEGIFLYGEEIVLGHQAHDLGYRAAIINTDVYIHDHIQKRFASRKMFWFDRQSLKVYYRMFGHFNPFQWIFLNTAIVLGTIEFNSAYYLFKTLRRI